MHDLRLTAREVVAPSRRFARFGALFGATLVAFLACFVVQTQDEAYALAKPPTVSTLPATLANVAEGAGEVVAVGAAGVGVVAAAPVEIPAATVALATAGGVALVMNVGSTLKYAWSLRPGQDKTYADPPGASLPQQNYPGGLSIAVGSSFGACPSSTGYGTSYSCAVVSMSNANWATTGTITATGYGTNAGGKFGANAVTGCGGGTCAYSNFSSAHPSGYFVSTSASNGKSVDAYEALKNSGTICVASNGALSSYQGTGDPCVASPVPATSTTAGTAPGGTTQTTTPQSTCSGSGGTVVGSPVSFTANDTTLPDLVLPACPAGTVRTGYAFPTTTSSGTVTPPFQPYTEPVVPSGFPQCQTPGGCQLNLYRVGHGTGAQTVSCSGTGACVDWVNQTRRSGTAVQVQRVSDGTQVSETPLTWPDGSTQECWWGPYRVEVMECTTVPTEPTPTPAAPAGTPDPTADDRSCFPHGFGMLNPLEWVYKPVKCALVWAFVPDPAVLNAASARLSTAWNGTALGTVSTAIGKVYAPIVSLKDAPTLDCDGPAFVIPKLPAMTAPVTLHPLSTCNELTQYMLGIYLPLASAAVYVGGFFAGTRRILSAFGAANPDGDDT